MLNFFQVHLRIGNYYLPIILFSKTTICDYFLSPRIVYSFRRQRCWKERSEILIGRHLNADEKWISQDRSVNLSVLHPLFNRWMGNWISTSLLRFEYGLPNILPAFRPCLVLFSLVFAKFNPLFCFTVQSITETSVKGCTCLNVQRYTRTTNSFESEENLKRM